VEIDSDAEFEEADSVTESDSEIEVSFHPNFDIVLGVTLFINSLFFFPPTGGGYPQNKGITQVEGHKRSSGIRQGAGPYRNRIRTGNRTGCKAKTVIILKYFSMTISVNIHQVDRIQFRLYFYPCNKLLESIQFASLVQHFLVLSILAADLQTSKRKLSLTSVA